MNRQVTLGRREFLKLGGMSLAALGLRDRGSARPWQEFPQADRLCRISETMINVHARPDPDSPVLNYVHFDDVLPVVRAIVGRGLYPHNHVWFEVPGGFIWSAYAQPVRNQVNPLLESIPAEGIWTEISVPYVEGRQQPDPDSRVIYRLYYSMVVSVDQRISGDNGEIWYRVHDENNIIMYAPGQSFRPLAEEELTPISPGTEDKEVRINLFRQELSAFEQGVEVYFCRISSGLYSRQKQAWNTPVGQWWTWRKMVSRHMSAGDALSGYDLPGVGWTILFSSDGAAIHSTYWHNDYGTPRSRGCVNACPEDARWLFRWTAPPVDYRPGDLTMVWPQHGTRVVVVPS